ncbi:MAG: replicative DNA helicase [Gammaproteobacteria bacterium]|nr:replicative DNA helicase [Gammaproteobacteria bacterium]NND53592.1 replicative DNA helicase [Gammaproteobacteria bacterium]
MNDHIKMRPAAVEAERALLGGIMLDPRAWDDVSGTVTEADFYMPGHQLIFGALKMLAERRQPLDPVTVNDYLESTGNADQVGGLQYIGTLTTETPSAANITGYAAIVREKSLLRSLIDVGQDITASGYNPDGMNAADLVDVAEQKVFEIAEESIKKKGDFESLNEVCVGMVDKLTELHQAGAAITGLPTGYKAFDEKSQGLQKGDLIILAGRPSMGKTTLALNIAEYVAFNVSDPQPVAVFSMEMSAEQLAMRFVSSLGKIPQSNLRNGKFADSDWPSITSALHQMSQAPVHIDDQPALSPMDLRSRARRLKAKHGLGLIVVDYLQLMQVPGTAENRTTEISAISRGLKSLARELEVPVIALSQLNRSVEQRPDKRPVMSDLRESGAIEQDADLILFIYRDEVYNPETPKKGQADVIIAKHRNGEIGDFPLTFLGQYSRFENHVREFDIPPDQGF